MWTIAGGIIIAWVALKLAGRAYRATQSVGFNTKLACAVIPKRLRYEDPAVIRERISSSQYTTNIYCNHCGAALAQDQLMCPSCGRTVAATLKTDEHNPDVSDDAVEQKCTRCSGTGEWRSCFGLDGICYACGGTGKRR